MEWARDQDVQDNAQPVSELFCIQPGWRSHFEERRKLAVPHAMADRDSCNTPCGFGARFFTSTRRVLRESVPVGGSSMASRDTPRGGRNAAVTRKTGVARCSGGRFIHTKPGQPISPQIQRHASGNSKLARARPLSRRHQTGQYICRHVNGCRRRWSLDHRRSGQRPSHITSIPYLKSVDAEQQPATRLSGQ